MNWFKKFMQGRYGLDEFSKAIIVLAIILGVLGAITDISIIALLSNGLMIYFIYRTFSKNIHKRFLENEYINQEILKPIKKQFSIYKVKIEDSKKFKYFKCPNCKQQLRVPRGKGKLTITCPKCNTKFDKKS